MIPIPLPAGLDIPEGQPVEVSATIQVMEGEAFIVALNGIPLDDTSDMEPEMEDEEEADFLSAVERQLG
jgi:hypothetical protein